MGVAVVVVRRLLLLSTLLSQLTSVLVMMTMRLYCIDKGGGRQ